jgi:hypothetical protein
MATNMEIMTNQQHAGRDQMNQGAWGREIDNGSLSGVVLEGSQTHGIWYALREDAVGHDMYAFQFQELEIEKTK